MVSELPERDFVREEKGKNPFPLWLWLFLATAFIAIIWGGHTWFGSYLNHKVEMSPFLQVTNREFSLFLWQNPEYMRINAKDKSGYLSGFQYIGKVNIEPELADKYVVAPPETLFLYHTWRRLVSREFSPRPIPQYEFLEFLSQIEEWDPKNWPAAPEGYVQIISMISSNNLPSEIAGTHINPDDLQTLPKSSLPIEVRMAFQGWKNYFKEGELINSLKPDFLLLDGFLTAHSGYARHYWRNIVEDKYPRYLLTMSSGDYDRLALVPMQEITPMLKVALFNFSQAKQGK